MNCVFCGAQMPADSKFCGSCGNTVHMPDPNSVEPFSNGPTLDFSGMQQQFDEFGNPIGGMQNGMPPIGNMDAFNGMNLSPEQQAAMQAQNDNFRIQRLANRGLGNAVFALILSLVSIILIGTLWWTILWGLMFIAVDLASSIPAIIQGVMGRKHSKPKFMATIAMAGVSILLTIGAIVLLFVRN